MWHNVVDVCLPAAGVHRSARFSGNSTQHDVCSAGDLLSSIKNFISGTASIFEDLAPPPEHSGALQGGGNGRLRSSSCPRSIRPANRQPPQRDDADEAAVAARHQRQALQPGRQKPTATQPKADDWGWGEGSPLRPTGGSRGGQDGPQTLSPSLVSSTRGRMASPESGQKGLLDAVRLHTWVPHLMGSIPYGFHTLLHEGPTPQAPQ